MRRFVVGMVLIAGVFGSALVNPPEVTAAAAGDAGSLGAPRRRHHHHHHNSRRPKREPVGPALTQPITGGVDRSEPEAEDTAGGPSNAADSADLVVALALAGALGLFGGVLLRSRHDADRWRGMRPRGRTSPRQPDEDAAHTHDQQSRDNLCRYGAPEDPYRRFLAPVDQGALKPPRAEPVVKGPEGQNHRKQDQLEYEDAAIRTVDEVTE
jgi:hypothetical protein